MQTAFSLIPPVRVPRPRASRDLETRLRPFLERGLIGGLPTSWQLLLGQLEMAPYVVMPDAGDRRRYAGARLGHPLLRTPLILSQIGWEHLRVGHGLHSTLETLLLHLAYVSHEGMPVFDLQLVQTHPDGLLRLRELLTRIESADDPLSAHHRRLIALINPDPSGYRRNFLEPDGWIDRAARFDYPPLETTATFLRPEFTTLTSFLDYCRVTFAPSPRGQSPVRIAAQMLELGSKRLRESGR